MRAATIDMVDDVLGASVPRGTPKLQREGLDLTLVWPNAVRFSLTAIRDSREGVRGELIVSQNGHRISWGAIALASTRARETLRKKLERFDSELPWDDYLEEAAWTLRQAAREGEPLVALTGHVTSPTRELLPRLLYEGEPTSLFADGDTGKSLGAQAICVAVQSGVALPFGLKPARAVPCAYLDWETSRDTLESRVGMLAAGLGVKPPPILYKRMARPLVDDAATLAGEFARRGIGLVVIDSMMFAVAGGEGAAFHEPITAFYNALRLFAPAASLVLNHVTNADARTGGPGRPFGGAFAFNGPRLIWEARRDREITDATAIAFTCTKANNLARKPEPFGLRFVPGLDTITVYPFDLAEAAPETLVSAPLRHRIRSVLASAPQGLALAHIAQALRAKPESVRKALQRMRDAQPPEVALEGDLYRLIK
jgi:AAA domain